MGYSRNSGLKNRREKTHVSYENREIGPSKGQECEPQCNDVQPQCKVPAGMGRKLIFFRETFASAAFRKIRAPHEGQPTSVPPSRSPCQGITKWKCRTPAAMPGSMASMAPSLRMSSSMPRSGRGAAVTF